MGRKGDKMPRPSTAYAAAHIFALENKLLSRDRVERMVEAPSASEALKVLSETEYAASVSELDQPHDYEKMLAKEIHRMYDFFQTMSPDPEITNLFFVKYDFHNLKVLLKARYLDREEDEPLIETGGTLPLNVLKEAIEEEDYTKLPDYIRETIEEVNQVMTFRVDPQKIAAILDRAMYRHIFNVCREKNNNFVLEYFTLQADLINIRTFLRVKKINQPFEFLKGLLLPGSQLGEDFFFEMMEEPVEHIADRLSSQKYTKVVEQGVEAYLNTGSLSTYERLMDDFLLKFVKASRWNPLGLEPIIGYLLAKENEIRIIRIIMVGKINNLPSPIIRERLRDVYV
ncbi:MAG: V-type ATP synthase subunit C [Caldicoprobacterales bacterium]